MDIFALLKKDHDEAKKLFEKLDNGDSERRDELFYKLRQALEIHSAIEEKAFYPALRNLDETRDMVLEAIEEHRIVQQLLDELDDGSEDDQWQAKLAVLKENVEHHIEEEENELFKKARKLLSDDDVTRMTRQALDQRQAETAH